MEPNRRVFLQQLVAGGTVSLVPGMLVNEPLTAHGMKRVQHLIDHNASHIADVFLKEASGEWQHHFFTVDIKVKPNDEGTALMMEFDHQLSQILESGHFVAGFGFQLQERKQTAQWRK